MSESRLTDSPFPIAVFIIEKRSLAIPTALNKGKPLIKTGNC